MAESSSYNAGSLRGGGPSISLVENNHISSNAGVGNYKGVMLCNRPFAGTNAGSKQFSQPEKNTFASGVVPEPIGVNIPISSKDKQKFKRPKKDSVIAKHRKWLADLQKTKDDLERQYIEELQRKQDSSKKFTEQEAKMRQLAKMATLSVDDKGGAHSNNNENDAAAEVAEAKEASSSAKESKSSASGAKGVHRPAWALTEEAAKTAAEDKLQGDEADLIAFAEGLDFERYIGDMEVQTMMERLRWRIGQLEKEVESDDKRETDGAQRAAKRELLAQMRADASSLAAEADGPEDDDDLDLAAARSLLQSEDQLLQAVHSTRSVAALVKTSKDKLSQGQGQAQAQGPAISNVINEPQVVTHVAGEGIRLELKNDINKLPYMHRNPAV